MIALLPYRTIAGFCLLISTGPYFIYLQGLGTVSAVTSVGISSIVLLGLLLAQQAETRHLSYYSAAAILAVLRTWSVLAIVFCIINGHINGSGLGGRMVRHLQFLKLELWWRDVMLVCVAIAVVEMLLGLLQIVAQKSSVKQ